MPPWRSRVTLLTFVAAIPAAPSRGRLAASVVLHVAYNYLLMTLYRLGDLSQTYPLARHLTAGDLGRAGMAGAAGADRRPRGRIRLARPHAVATDPPVWLIGVAGGAMSAAAYGLVPRPRPSGIATMYLA